MGKVLLKLAEIRAAQGLTQEDLARLAKTVTVRTVASAESGRGVSLSTSRCLAKALGVKIESLL